MPSLSAHCAFLEAWDTCSRITTVFLYESLFPEKNILYVKTCISPLSSINRPHLHRLTFRSSFDPPPRSKSQLLQMNLPLKKQPRETHVSDNVWAQFHFFLPDRLQLDPSFELQVGYWVCEETLSGAGLKLEAPGKKENTSKWTMRDHGRFPPSNSQHLLSDTAPACSQFIPKLSTLYNVSVPLSADERSSTTINFTRRQFIAHNWTVKLQI